MTENLVARVVALPDGVRLEYVEQGDTGGTPVIFLHGVTDSWRSFEPVLRRLPASVRAFALSQRGHGESSRPESGYRYRDFSEDVRAFMDANGLASAVIVGHSMGSLVAQRLAADHPDRIRGLVLVGAFATIHGSEGIAEFVDTTIRPLTDPISTDFARQWQLSTTARPIDPDLLEVVVGETLKVPARVWHAAFEGFLATPDFSGELGGLAAPVLIVWGDQDAYAGRADQDALLAALPAARFVALQGVGHAVHWEVPDRFVSELLRFLERAAG